MCLVLPLALWRISDLPGARGKSPTLPKLQRLPGPVEEAEAPSPGQRSCAVGAGEQEFPEGAHSSRCRRLQRAPEAIPPSWAATAEC